MRSMPGNPWDGHTLAETIEQASILTDKMPKTVIVDRGYQGVVVDGVQILRSGQRRGVTRGLKAMIKRRSPLCQDSCRVTELKLNPNGGGVK